MTCQDCHDAGRPVVARQRCARCYQRHRRRRRGIAPRGSTLHRERIRAALRRRRQDARQLPLQLREQLALPLHALG